MFFHKIPKFLIQLSVSFCFLLFFQFLFCLFFRCFYIVCKHLHYIFRHCIQRTKILNQGCILPLVAHICHILCGIHTGFFCKFINKSKSWVVQCSLQSAVSHFDCSVIGKAFLYKVLCLCHCHLLFFTVNDKFLWKHFFRFAGLLFVFLFLGFFFVFFGFFSFQVFLVNYFFFIVPPVKAFGFCVSVFTDSFCFHVFFRNGLFHQFCVFFHINLLSPLVCRL